MQNKKPYYFSGTQLFYPILIVLSCRILGFILLLWYFILFSASINTPDYFHWTIIILYLSHAAVYFISTSRQFIWCFKKKRQAPQLRVIDNPAERLKTNIAFTNLSMTVFAAEPGYLRLIPHYNTFLNFS